MKFWDRLIAWVQRRDQHPLRVVTHEDGRLLLWRYCPFWPDEFIGGNGHHHCRPPWWRPFNVLFHKWEASHREEMHDHPRWSVTICLKGGIVEYTPWSRRVLTPGSVVFRSRRAIHALEVLPGSEAWTVFIVGRRNYQQNGYLVLPFGRPRPKIEWESKA